jgi:hypothetical protein
LRTAQTIIRLKMPVVTQNVLKITTNRLLKSIVHR